MFDHYKTFYRLVAILLIPFALVPVVLVEPTWGGEGGSDNQTEMVNEEVVAAETIEIDDDPGASGSYALFSEVIADYAILRWAKAQYPDYTQEALNLSKTHPRLTWTVVILVVGFLFTIPFIVRRIWLTIRGIFLWFSTKRRFAIGEFRNALEAEREGKRNEAEYHFRRSAEAGYVPAFFKLGCILLYSQKKYLEALDMFERGAAKGDKEARYQLGKLRLYGVPGIDSMKDVFEAQKQFKKCGRHGGALHQLGFIHQNGLLDGRPRLKKAVRCYKRSAKLGNLAGITATGFCAENGIGMARDMKLAEQFYREAANLGHAPAMYNLGRILRDKDPEEALMWLAKAIRLGYAKATPLHQQIQQQMGRDPQIVK
ncbi:MAG: sel1 repeat family protein [Thermoguttaceae bacterium]|nr:sel1 repeat family protein [Thermoguttaceae bacterium]